jgi:hypothetical protein
MDLRLVALFGGAGQTFATIMARLKGAVHLQILLPSVARHSRTRRAPWTISSSAGDQFRESH